MIDSLHKKNNQRTLANSFCFSGIGLHSGKESNVVAKPALEDTGIVFVRKDIKENNTIRAHWSNVCSTKLCTTISNDYDVCVSTIEHLMSALSGMHIDNVIIEIDGSEVPILDGSAKPIVDLIEKAGINKQSKERKYIKVLKKITVSDETGYASLSPNNEFAVDLEIDFSSSVINKQSCQLKMVNGNYKEDISRARTFGFEHEVGYLRKKGFALGGSLSNAVVVNHEKILNKEGLRYKDEFVRHKILDSIGDLYLAGAPVIGFFEGKKSGHKLNYKILEKLLSSKSNWKYI